MKEMLGKALFTSTLILGTGIAVEGIQDAVPIGIQQSQIVDGERNLANAYALLLQPGETMFELGGRQWDLKIPSEGPNLNYAAGSVSSASFDIEDAHIDPWPLKALSEYLRAEDGEDVQTHAANGQEKIKEIVNDLDRLLMELDVRRVREAAQAFLAGGVVLASATLYLGYIRRQRKI